MQPQSLPHPARVHDDPHRTIEVGTNGLGVGVWGLNEHKARGQGFE